MTNTPSQQAHRTLCEQRDKEFLALYNPTLDALLKQGMNMSKARSTAAEFTIANGHPHYHVEHERAYRCVCHLLKANEKKGAGARDYGNKEIDLAENRLRRKMWEEITGHVRFLSGQGMSVDQAIDHVLEHCRASRFFITPATALTRICPKSRSRALR
ncbi:MAG: hypothetical protein IKZ92_01765 [Muribaculaceae bacterium]|nr:hypothetical protein [Muribaculaceae bacterium]